MTFLVWGFLGLRRICSLNNVPRPPDIANIRNALKLVVLGIKRREAMGN
jgi:hypothetical protein